MSESSVLDDVFERFLEGAHIFRDREVLRYDYVPRQLPHRGEQIRYLGEILAPVLMGSRCSSILIYGTGKTAVVKYVSSKLAHKARGLELQSRSVT